MRREPHADAVVHAPSYAWRDGSSQLWARAEARHLLLLEDRLGHSGKEVCIREAAGRELIPVRNANDSANELAGDHVLVGLHELDRYLSRLLLKLTGVSCCLLNRPEHRNGVGISICRHNVLHMKSGHRRAPCVAAYFGSS